MDAADILALIKEHLTSSKPDENLTDLDNRAVADILASSFDVIDLVMHLEDKLNLEEEIELETLAPQFAGNTTFAQLAQAIVAYLKTHE